MSQKPETYLPTLCFFLKITWRSFKFEPSSRGVTQKGRLHTRKHMLGRCKFFVLLLLRTICKLLLFFFGILKVIRTHLLGITARYMLAPLFRRGKQIVSLYQKFIWILYIAILLACIANISYSEGRGSAGCIFQSIYNLYQSITRYVCIGESLLSRTS